MGNGLGPPLDARQMLATAQALDDDDQEQTGRSLKLLRGEICACGDLVCCGRKGWMGFCRNRMVRRILPSLEHHAQTLGSNLVVVKSRCEVGRGVRNWG
jgi:hypothetical protein